jgi:2-oxoglutarate ferredoxin oxidoreductase subunit gamma
VIIDSTNVKSAELPGAEQVYRLPITEVAIRDVGSRITANVVALGVINEVENLVSWESLHQALIDRVPARSRPLNERALRIGRALPLQAARH